MNSKGNISSISSDGKRARVLLRDKNVLTAEIPIADHIINLAINDRVTVMFFSNSLADGIIIARW
ncbi:MAG: hypothetical protein K0S75_1439 [Clostridia bacterium]|jgi:hypothetical protein|nr:hypothetical protein [Clostridia bacterium]